MYASHHFILGATCPVFGIAFGAEGLCSSRPSGFADDCFPGARRGFYEGRHGCSFDALVDDCTEIVPSNQSIERLNRPLSLVMESLFLYPFVSKGIIFALPDKKMVGPAGLEPATNRL